MEAVRKIYTPATNSRTGEVYSARYEPGSELGWRAIAGGPAPFGAAVDHFKFIVFKDPNWDWRTFNFDTDVALADKIDDGTINATSTDLKAFVAHGGKLMMYQGYTDTNLPPGNVITYFGALSKTLGAAKMDECGAPLHGARHESLRRRRGTELLRHGGRDGAMGRNEKGSGQPSLPLTAATARSIAHGRCARTRRSRSTKAPAASTKPPASAARFLNRDPPKPLLTG